MKKYKMTTFRLISLLVTAVGFGMIIVFSAEEPVFWAGFAVAIAGIWMLYIERYLEMYRKKMIDSSAFRAAIFFHLGAVVILSASSFSAVNARLRGHSSVSYLLVDAAVLLAMLLYNRLTLFSGNRKTPAVREKAQQKTMPVKTRRIQTSSYLNNEKRRYTLLAKKLEKGNGTASILGVVHGEIKKGDTVLILCAGKHDEKASVISIITGEEKKESARDCLVMITVNTENVELYSVITSIYPNTATNAPLENPLLKGMMYEYKELHQNHEYITLFYNALIHSRFIVPVYMDHFTQMVNSGAGIAHEVKMRFLSVNRSESKDSQTFAVFTDNLTLESWYKRHKDSGSVKLPITFQDAVQIMWKGHDGIVLNPFGPVYVYLPTELIDRITKQESYRDEFGAPGETSLSFVPRDDRNK